MRRLKGWYVKPIDQFRTFGTPMSTLTQSPRKAINPANALLNYAYAILEAECRIALLAVGLDPGHGMLLADLKACDSLALDLTEAVRRQIDRQVLRLLGSDAFAARDIFEARHGVCRVLAPLAHRLAETGPTWAKAIVSAAEGIARVLVCEEGRGGRAHLRLPTPLTGKNRSAGRSSARKRPELNSADTTSPLAAACRACGVLLTGPERTYCDECLLEQRAESAAVFAPSSPKALAQLRCNSSDPAHGGEADRKRGRRNAEHITGLAVWDDIPSIDDFDRAA